MCCIGNSNIIDLGTWAAIASALSAVCSLVITVIIGLSQRKREQQAQKISLFEKRICIMIHCFLLSVVWETYQVFTNPSLNHLVIYLLVYVIDKIGET